MIEQPKKEIPGLSVTLFLSSFPSDPFVPIIKLKRSYRCCSSKRPSTVCCSWAIHFPRVKKFKKRELSRIKCSLARTLRFIASTTTKRFRIPATCVSFLFWRYTKSLICIHGISKSLHTVSSNQGNVLQIPIRVFFPKSSGLPLASEVLATRFWFSGL